MAENRPPSERMRIGKRHLRLAAQALAVALSSFAALPSYADLRPAARPRPRPMHAMRFVRVTSADAACKPNCPEWLSAEGGSTGLGEGLRQCDCESQRAPVADPHPFPGRIGRRCRGHGRTHTRQGARGRRRPDLDRRLSGNLAEMSGWPRQSDHWRRDLRLGLRACARRRG